MSNNEDNQEDDIGEIDHEFPANCELLYSIARQKSGGLGEAYLLSTVARYLAARFTTIPSPHLQESYLSAAKDSFSEEIDELIAAIKKDEQIAIRDRN